MKYDTLSLGELVWSLHEELKGARQAGAVVERIAMELALRIGAIEPKEAAKTSIAQGYVCPECGKVMAPYRSRPGHRKAPRNIRLIGHLAAHKRARNKAQAAQEAKA